MRKLTKEKMEKQYIGGKKDSIKHEKPHLVAALFSLISQKQQLLDAITGLQHKIQ